MYDVFTEVLKTGGAIQKPRDYKLAEDKRDHLSAVLVDKNQQGQQECSGM